MWWPGRPRTRYPNPSVSGSVFGEREAYRDELAFIRAYGSTDLGVSFYVEAEGKRFFHAGDLNDWHWNQEVPPGRGPGIYSGLPGGAGGPFPETSPHWIWRCSRWTAAWAPDAANGAVAFLSAIPTRVFAPMHFGEDYRTQDGLVARGPFGGTR